MPIPNLKDFVIENTGIDKLASYQLELWHNNDYVTLTPGIVARIIIDRKLQDGNMIVVSDEIIKITDQLAIRNEEEKAQCSRDYDVKIHSSSHTNATLSISQRITRCSLSLARALESAYVFT
jgi:hypothetical protein